MLLPIGNPRKNKPQSLEEYGCVRWEILNNWKNQEELDPNDFIKMVTIDGCPFYGAQVDTTWDGEDGSSFTSAWESQVLVGVDFDDLGPDDWHTLLLHYKRIGLCPWFAYETFSGPGNFRFVFLCDNNPNDTQEMWAHTIKVLQHIGGVSSDKHAGGTTRMWQGSNQGTLYVARGKKAATINTQMFNFNSKAIR